MLLTANQHAAEHAGTTSTGVILGAALTFTASAWTLRNTGTVPLRFSLASTAPSTSDAELRSGQTIETTVPAMRYGVLTTSTSTDGVDHRRVSVQAWGA